MDRTWIETAVVTGQARTQVIIWSMCTVFVHGCCNDTVLILLLLLNNNKVNQLGVQFIMINQQTELNKGHGMYTD